MIPSQKSQPYKVSSLEGYKSTANPKLPTKLASTCMISAFIYNTPPKNINAIKEPAARNTANSIDSQTLKIPDIMSPPIISRSALTNATPGTNSMILPMMIFP